MIIPRHYPVEARNFLAQLFAHDDQPALLRAFNSKHFRHKLAERTGLSDQELLTLAESFAATIPPDAEQRANERFQVRHDLLKSYDPAIERTWTEHLGRELPGTKADTLAEQVRFFAIECAAIGSTDLDKHLRIRCRNFVDYVRSR
jgi:hypothetical protein